MADSFERELKALTAKIDAMAEQIPAKAVAVAAKSGAEIVRRSVTGRAPTLSGDLRGGIILHKERSRTAGKAVYDVMMDPKKNYLFQKPILHPDRSEKAYAYYPASQEYGYYKRRPGGGLEYVAGQADASAGEKVPGKHYMARGTAAAEAAASNQIVQSLGDHIEKLWR